MSSRSIKQSVLYHAVDMSLPYCCAVSLGFCQTCPSLKTSRWQQWKCSAVGFTNQLMSRSIFYIQSMAQTFQGSCCILIVLWRFCSDRVHMHICCFPMGCKLTERVNINVRVKLTPSSCRQLSLSKVCTWKILKAAHQRNQPEMFFKTHTVKYNTFTSVLTLFPHLQHYSPDWAP